MEKIKDKDKVELLLDFEIKKYKRGKIFCVAYTNTYVHSIAYINNLVSMAKKDFPTLKDVNINIIKYGGNRIANMYGIEFEVNITSDFLTIDYKIGDSIYIEDTRGLTSSIAHR